MINNPKNINKQDMISIIVDISLQKRLLEIFGPEENKIGVLGVIQYKVLAGKIIISCISGKTRDNLFDLLIKSLT